MDAIQQEQGLVQATERRIEDTLKEKEKKNITPLGDLFVVVVQE